MIVITEIAIIVIAVAVVAITFYLIPLLKQLRQTASTMDQTVKSLEIRLKPLLEETQQTMKDISEMTASMKSQVNKMEDSMENFRNLIDRSHKLSVLIYDQIELPILKTLENIKALQSGCKSFFSVLISNRKEG